MDDNLESLFLIWGGLMLEGAKLVWMILEIKSSLSGGCRFLSGFFNRGTKRLEFFV